LVNFVHEGKGDLYQEKIEFFVFLRPKTFYTIRKPFVQLIAQKIALKYVFLKAYKTLNTHQTKLIRIKLD
jgi:hypothetical protein